MALREERFIAAAVRRLTPQRHDARIGEQAARYWSASEAIAAAPRPAEGDWMYFVTVDRQGTTVFTSDHQQHLVNVELARAHGVLDSAR